MEPGLEQSSEAGAADALKIHREPWGHTWSKLGVVRWHGQGGAPRRSAPGGVSPSQDCSEER